MNKISLSINNLLLAGASLFFVSLSASASNANKWTEKVTLASDVFCPFNCGPNDKILGTSIEIAQKAFGAENLNYVILPWKRALQDVRDLKVDGVLGATVADEPTFLYSKVMSKVNNCFYTRKDNPWVYKNHDSIKGNKLGYISAYPYPEFILSYINKDNSLELSGNDVLKNLLKMIVLKRIDTVVDDESVINYVLSNDPETAKNIKSAGCINDSSGIIPLMAGFPPKSPRTAKILARLNETIDEMIKDGEMQKLADKYKIRKWW